MAMKTFAKKLLNLLLSDYEIYKIYTQLPPAGRVGEGSLACHSDGREPSTEPRSVAQFSPELNSAQLNNSEQQRPAEIANDGLRFHALGSADRVRLSTDVSDAHLLSDALYQKNQGYVGDGAKVFVCLQQQRIVGICIYWYGARYLARNFITLKPDEAKLVHIETLPEHRGKGIATQLIRYSAAQMFSAGFSALYARIWHSNTPSIKSFTNASWQYLTTIVTARGILFGYLKLRLKPFKISR